MRLLILGGTRFLGRHLAGQALAQGHRLTLLHRGRSAGARLAGAEHLLADRDADLSALHGRNWDAVIDTCAYRPAQVRAAAAALAGRVGHYHLVSSISAYATLDAPGTTEDAPLASLPDAESAVLSGETYGGLKAACEAAAQAAFGPRCSVSRPGLLVGPHDPTGRFTWWVQRLARGGTVLAPGDAAVPVQFIDARDAAAWMLGQVQRGSTGAFNLTGPLLPLTVGQWLSTSRDTLAPAAQLAWVDEAFVLAQGVSPWADLPVWLPRAQAALHQVDITRARDSGLQCRALADTLRDTAAWAATAGPDSGPAAPCPGVGLEPAREAAILAAWAARG